MKLWLRLLVGSGSALFLTANLLPGYAAEAHMHRCVDTDGRIYYTDRPGKACAQGEHDRLTRHGLVLDRPKDEEAIKAAEAEAAAEQNRKIQAQKRYDQTLLAIYSSEDQIEYAKQRRLQTPLLSLELTMKKILTQQERLAELHKREVALSSNDESIPEKLKRDIDYATSEIARLEREVESKETSLNEIASRFESDKKRYRELTEPPSR